MSHPRTCLRPRERKKKSNLMIKSVVDTIDSQFFNPFEEKLENNQLLYSDFRCESLLSYQKVWNEEI